MKKFLLLALVSFTAAQRIGETQWPYDWVGLEYDWPSDEDRVEAIRNETFIVENNVITGIKVHRDEVYLTVSRWLKGVPSTMNKIINKNGRNVLQPYPSWEMQTLDDCNALQFTQSMEIDPEAEEMWIIDAGRRNFWNASDEVNNCPPKLVIIDLNTNMTVHSYTFNSDVFNHTGNHVNDIVIDPDLGYAYMTDTGNGPTGHKGGIVVYNRNTRRAHRMEHWSMLTEPENMNVTIDGNIFPMDVPSDGIALSRDKSQLYYCALGAVSLWTMTTRDAQNPPNDLNDTVRYLGDKPSQSDGLLMGHKNLYYGSLSMDAVHMWEHGVDSESQNATLENVNMTTTTLLNQDSSRMVWADTFSLDAEGWLWVTANRLPLFKERMLSYTGSQPNFYVGKIYVDDLSYLATEVGPTTDPSGATNIVQNSVLILVLVMSALLNLSR